MTVLGTLVFDERIWPIRKIGLKHGKFAIEVETYGPMEGTRYGVHEYHLHDGEGNLVCSGKTGIQFMALFAGDTLAVTLYLAVDGKEARPDEERK